MGISERRKELRRRRHRREKLKQLYRRFLKAPPSEKQAILDKVRALTPGYLDVYRNWGVLDQYLQGNWRGQ
ncbi:MAG: hypothetical protein NZ899_04315 [Thermoguttaceae bacterium]|nr:hypothetical protein [Thermoguttaceae bacterium]MDW8077640.1 hypothetical protein [Thermoguttaceae bacterium]